MKTTEGILAMAVAAAPVAAAAQPFSLPEIGRASCRERV